MNENKKPNNGQQKPGKGTPERRPLWDLHCLSICTLFGVALTEGEVEQLVRKYAPPCLCEDIENNPSLLLQVSHASAHHLNLFSRDAQNLLDDKYREQVAWVSRQSNGGLRDRLDRISLESSEMPGIIWGLMTRPDPVKQEIAERLVHKYLWYAFRSFRLQAIPPGEPPDTPSSTPEIDSMSPEELRCKVRDQAETIERMLEFISRTRPDEAFAKEVYS